MVYSVENLIKLGLPVPKNLNRKQTSFTEEVNSIHHQAVMNRPQDAVILSVYAGKTKGDAVIESLYYPKHNIYTVQWHPEEIQDGMSVAIINKLLKKRDEQNTL